MTSGALISISVVSHARGNLARDILSDLSTLIDPADFEIILTKNLPERLPFSSDEFAYPLKVIENSVPKGFGANHNAAFHLARGEYFCVMNPDIRMPENPFPILIEEIERQHAAVIAPAVLTPAGQVEDSIRRFPTPLSLAGKMLGRSDGRYPFSVGDETFAADWVGGMFMLFRAEDYRRVGGFDEGFFLYYEDVDICTRLWQAGRRALVVLNGTPDNYEYWLAPTIDFSQSSGEGEKLVFINVWNEWAEGCHLEPDRWFGHGFLQATLNAQSGLRRFALFPETSLPQSIEASYHRTFWKDVGDAVSYHAAAPDRAARGLRAI